MDEPSSEPLTAREHFELARIETNRESHFVTVLMVLIVACFGVAALFDYLGRVDRLFDGPYEVLSETLMLYEFPFVLPEGSTLEDYNLRSDRGITSRTLMPGEIVYHRSDYEPANPAPRGLIEPVLFVIRSDAPVFMEDPEVTGYVPTRALIFTGTLPAHLATYDAITTVATITAVAFLVVMLVFSYGFIRSPPSSSTSSDLSPEFFTDHVDKLIMEAFTLPVDIDAKDPKQIDRHFKAIMARLDAVDALIERFAQTRDFAHILKREAARIRRDLSGMSTSQRNRDIEKLVADFEFFKTKLETDRAKQEVKEAARQAKEAAGGPSRAAEKESREGRSATQEKYRKAEPGEYPREAAEGDPPKDS